VSGRSEPNRRARGDPVGAAIDVGSNSVHLLVARFGPGHVQPLLDESELLGLGDVVDREGRLTGAGIAAAVSAVHAYAERARTLGAEDVVIVGTEPVRRASDRSVLQADVLRIVGRPLQVLSHEAEACLTFLGVSRGRPPIEPELVLDIGGGSSEVIVAAVGREPIIGAIATGSGRLTAGFVRHDPPSWFEVNALRAEAARACAGLPAARPSAGTIVGGSGSNLVKVAAARGASAASLDRHALDVVFGLATTLSVGHIVGSGLVKERRARQLAAGAALVEAVLERYGLDELRASDASLRDGAILASAAAGDAWPERLRGMVVNGVSWEGPG
jgi:exopolyphosphatase / guanosine-5'-triphosphate,3'-diphosphate pyrophosphatase